MSADNTFPPLDPVNPLTILTTEDVVPEAVMDIADWYELETMTIVKPVIPVLNDSLPAYTDMSALTGWMTAQGWKLASSEQTTYKIPWISWTNAAGAEVQGLDYHNAQADTWTRRRLVPERPLRDMIGKFTAAYNEGRRLNNQRYNEIVLVYGALLEKSENFLAGIRNDTVKYDALLDGILDNLGKDFPEYEADIKQRLAAMAAALAEALANARALMAMKAPAADALAAARALLAAVEPAGTVLDAARTALDDGVAAYQNDVANLLDGDYGAARRAEINRAADARRAAAQLDLVNRGLYNGGAYAPTLARIEEARQLALNDLADKLADRRFALCDKLLGARTGYPLELARLALSCAFNAADRGVDLEKHAVAVGMDLESRAVDFEKYAIDHTTGLDRHGMDVLMRLFQQRIQIQKDLLDAAERLRRMYADPNALPFTQLQMRNAIVKDLLDFAERRQDAYPNLDALATLTERIGAASPA